MSIQLTPVDLTSAVTGTSGNVKFPIPGISGQNPSVRIYNESGCELQVTFSNGSSDFIPAGAWPVFEIDPTVTGYSFVVSGVIPNAPISTLNTIYYYPGDPIPSNMVLGNSPIGITGSVSTASNSLSNEGNAVGTEVIDIGTAANNKLIDIFNDHFIWKVEQTGVAHQVMKGQTSGNPLQLGQSSDVLEVLSKLTLDDILTVAGALFFNVAGISTNGSTSGTSLLTEPFQGTALKVVKIFQNNFRNGAAGSTNVALPTAFTEGCLFVTSNVAGFALLASGVAITITDITSLATGGGTGTNASPSQINSWCIGGAPAAFDTVQYTGNNGSAHTGHALLVGS